MLRKGCCVGYGHLHFPGGGHALVFGHVQVGNSMRSFHPVWLRRGSSITGGEDDQRYFCAVAVVSVYV